MFCSDRSDSDVVGGTLDMVWFVAGLSVVDKTIFDYLIIDYGDHT